MFDMVDTAFPYWRAFIICLFLQESSKVKESSLHCNLKCTILHFYFVGKTWIKIPGNITRKKDEGEYTLDWSFQQDRKIMQATT